VGTSKNEFAMMQLARAIGIDVPEIRLIPLREIAGLPGDVARLEGNALAVKRFDRREEGGLVHSEDFAQLFGVYPEKNMNVRATGISRKFCGPKPVKRAWWNLSAAWFLMRLSAMLICISRTRR
jgi:serine/threonine protein kinase HipA of HipAB toxin-antitoxin module